MPAKRWAVLATKKRSCGRVAVDTPEGTRDCAGDSLILPTHYGTIDGVCGDRCGDLSGRCRGGRVGATRIEQHDGEQRQQSKADYINFNYD